MVLITQNPLIRMISSVCLAVWLGATACSSDGLYTNKIAAPALVSKLYGSSSQVVSLTHTESVHIGWMGFIQGNDYQYFKVTKVEVGGETILEDGEKNYTANSQSIVKDITISPSTTTGDNDFVNGSINVAGSGDLKIKFTYSPAVAMESDTPHEAYYIIYYDQAVVRIKLTGYTKGILAEKCTSDPSSMETVTYSVKNDTVKIFVCGSAVADAGMNNDTEHGSSTNVAEVPFPEGSVVTFYKADAETVCILGASDKVDTPSVPDFVLPVPEGLGSPVDSLDIMLRENDYAECALDASGNISCEGDVPLIVAQELLPLSGFDMTNQTFTADEMKTTDCTDFGELSGSGVLDGSSDLTIVLRGEILSGTYSDSFNISGAAVIGVVELEAE